MVISSKFGLPIMAKIMLVSMKSSDILRLSMILRLFAKIHARARRRFFRFTRWQRFALIGGVLAIVLGVGELYLANHVAKRLPWFSSQHRVYLLWNDRDSFRQHLSVAASALAQVSDVETTEWEILLDSLMQSRSLRYGVIIPEGENAQPIMFAVQPEQAFGVMADSWMQRASADGQVVSFSAGALTEPSRFAWAWWKALKIRALQSSFSAVAQVHEPRFPTFYVGVEVRDNGWNVFASTQSSPIRHAVVEETTELGLPTLKSQVNLTSFPLISNLPIIWQQLSLYPLTVELVSGQWQAMVDPFALDSEWRIQASASAESAQQWLQTILNELMITFPLAEQRLLPDRGIVYELKRKADFFLPANTTLDVQTYPSGSFTYPRGQMTYSFADDVLVFQKGVAEGELFTKACHVPDSLVSFSSSGQALGTGLWRSLFLGLDEKKITLCLRW